MNRTKRVLDLVLASLALVLAAPLLLSIAVLVRVFLGSPVLFRQVRAGYRGRAFTCLKFRSMSDQRDRNGQLLPDETRLTALGRFLRASSADELPSLINVLRGEMSLVGPRPLLMEYLQRYTANQARRHDVKPGITGWAQVNGRNGLTWEEKFEYDLWYVDHQSFWLDVKIIVLTLWKILSREGISQPGHATMAKFTGFETQENRSQS